MTDSPSRVVGHVVLYIEDNPDNIRLVERLLMSRPTTTLHVATTAHDGIKAAVDLAPDLILLDNRLPDATGSDVLSQLGASAITSAIPVVILTGDSDRKTADKFLAIGATEFLAKPFDIHEFLAIIDRHLH